MHRIECMFYYCNNMAELQEGERCNVRAKGSSIETPLNYKQLISLNYPGVVKNPSKMLETLGGESKLTKAFNDDRAPLSLNFQPGNPYCKPARGVATRSTSLLMKVKHRYRRHQESEEVHPSTSTQEEGQTHEEYSAEVLGVIGHKYEFPYLCDFQYLPYEQKPNGEVESLIEKILPSAGEDISYVDKDVPCFMLPEIFSKFDKPTEYNYKAGQQLRKFKQQQQHETDFRAKLIQHGRHKRTNYAHVVSTMGDFEVPKEPHPTAVVQLEAQKPGTATDEIRKLFEERPLWSRNALRCNTDISTALIKGILCVVAYYFQQGPWRGLWCRLGYDPREHPESKKYQLLDFRLRKELTDKRLKLLLKKKRTILYPQQSFKHKRGIPTPLLGSHPDQEVDHKESSDSYYIMRRGILPAYHQMFYQLCDLEDPELQAIVNNPRWHKTKANMKTGYFEMEMFRQLRDALTQMIKDTVIEVNARKSQQDGASQSSMPSTSASGLEQQMEGEIEEEDEDEEAIGKEEEDEEEDDDVEEVGLDDDDDDDDDVDEGEDMEEQDIMDVGHGRVDDEDDEGGMVKDDGEESDSENEMAMEMLEFMDSGTLPS